MNKLKIYRTVTFTLLALFLVFNVGLPIVLASCPMMQEKHTTSTCCEQKNDRFQAIKSSKDYSCCKTVIAAERNTTEFVQGKDCLVHVDYSLITLLHLTSLSKDFSQLLLTSVCNTSPPSEDIPIFTSSLLI